MLLDEIADDVRCGGTRHMESTFDRRDTHIRHSDELLRQSPRQRAICGQECAILVTDGCEFRDAIVGIIGGLLYALAEEDDPILPSATRGDTQQQILIFRTTAFEPRGDGHQRPLEHPLGASAATG